MQADSKLTSIGKTRKFKNAFFTNYSLTRGEKIMSQKELEKKDEGQLSEEQLQGVSGGLTERFDDARRDNLEKGLSDDEGPLSEEQLKGVAGGLSERFEGARDENRSNLTERFDDAREGNLDK
jgi:phage shock protein PspC (stress-responsive transcriptional regulator)